MSSAKNAAIIKVTLRKFTEDVAKKKLLAMLKQVAQILVDHIDRSFEPLPPSFPGGTTQFPVWTGNLHDSTGVGVYCDGALSAFMPTKTALRPNDGVDGTAALYSAITAAATTFPTGLWIVLFSSVPYAFNVDVFGSKWGRGQDFFANLKITLLQEVFTGLKPLNL